ncbi:Impact-like protein [Spironucleus salmonicida]|uniref:Impact-like protein n=1 Tax=Spironucleus salmonicida TaxID=348837 RepID=V6LPW8_9EUKA|nr:Impact-like protein [Spironucleus salmonicida]|eukprot:EST42799.1 Impact-like protein [Spironucleus salmonicida]
MDEIREMVQTLIPQYYIHGYSSDELQLKITSYQHQTVVVCSLSNIDIQSNIIPKLATQTLMIQYQNQLDQYLPTLLLDLVAEIEQIMISQPQQNKKDQVEYIPATTSVNTHPVFYRSLTRKVQKSTFFASSKLVSTNDEALTFARFISNLPECYDATHNMAVWKVNGDTDYDEDGESGAGEKMAFLLHKMQINGICIVVTRFFGGVKLGGMRFRIICDVMREGAEGCNVK